MKTAKAPTQRFPNKVRVDETGDFFKANVLKMLNLTSVPPDTDNCAWEEIHNALSTQGKTLAGHLLEAIAHQNLCMTSLLIQAGEVPSENMIESAAEGDSRILRACLRSKKIRISYQALLNAVDVGRKDNVAILLEDRRAPVVPSNINNPSLLATAVKKKNKDIVNLLLANATIDPSGSNNKALYTAAYNNDVDMMRLLINAGANPNLPESPFIAATVGNLEAVNFLLSDPNVDKSKIPVEFLRIADENRGSQVVRHTVNKDLPPKNKEDFTKVVKILNSALYGDKIAGMFLGLHLASGSVDSNTIHTALTGRSFNSRLLRYLALEKYNPGQVLDWITKNIADFSNEERMNVGEACNSVLEDTEFSGNVPLAALLTLLYKKWTFQELYEEVSRENIKEDTLMTCLLIGAYLGLEGSLLSGIADPPDSVYDASGEYTDKTNFAVMRPLKQ